MVFRDNQDDGAPTIVMLWDKLPKARQPHLCDRCGEEIAVGTIYHSLGLREDGEFISAKTHRWAYQHPSGCPRFRASDLAEMGETPSTPRVGG